MTAARPFDAAAAWLLRAFAPGSAALLRSWADAPARDGDRLTIIYDLPDRAAMARARELQRGAKSLRLVRVGPTIIGDLTARVSRKHRTFSIAVRLCGASEGKADG